MGIAETTGYEYAVAQEPLIPAEGGGDRGFVLEQKHSLLVVVLDVLGHGEKASRLASECETFLRQRPAEDPCLILQALHEHIRKSRGAAVTAASVDRESGNTSYAAVGNICARLFGVHHKRLVNQDGVVGYRMPTVRSRTFTLSRGGVFLVYTDGIREHFHEDDYPGMRDDKIQVVADEIMRRFGKGTDDACCCVLRRQK